MIRDADKWLKTNGAQGRPLYQLANAVGLWSHKNFGDQQTSELSTEQPPGAIVHLRGLAPMMGMVEEHGEFLESMYLENPLEGKMDALGDQAIYFCDFLFREMMPAPDIDTLADNEQFQQGAAVTIALGRMFRAKLKRCQGIRGYEQVPKYRAEMAMAASLYWRGLNELSIYQVGVTALDLGWNTWDKIVSKRDWEASAADGGGHSHEAECKACGATGNNLCPTLHKEIAQIDQETA